MLGTVVYSAFGIGGYAVVCLYFLLGSAVSPQLTRQRDFESSKQADQSVILPIQCASDDFCVALQATKVKLKQKQAEGIAEGRSGRRSIVSLCDEQAAQNSS